MQTPPPFLFRKTTGKGAEPTPPMDHPRQLDGCPGGAHPFSSFVPTFILMNRYCFSYLFRTNLVSYYLFD